MKTKKILFVIFEIFLLSLLLVSCTNFFHSLLPPDGNDILNFQVQYENGSRSTTYSPDKNNNLTIIVPDGTDVTNLIPVVNISEKAEIIPGDYRYLTKMFPNRDLLSLVAEMRKARLEGNFIDWFVNLIFENKGLDIPKLNMPVDFTIPVPFYVISGQGSYKIYTVTVITESGKVQLDNSPYDPTKTEKNILSFEVENQIGISIIDNSNCTVDFEVSPEENINSILPVITVSDGAIPLPLTQQYLQACNFSFEQIIDFYAGFTTATDINRYISLYFQKQDDLILPQIDIPIDFSSEVLISVIAGDRSAKVYTITAKIDETTPYISEFAIGKTKNPFIMKDAEVTLSKNEIVAKLLYPVEIKINYSLIVDFVFTGDKVTYKFGTAPEVELNSGITQIPFNIIIDSCVLTVYAGSKSTKYTLILDRQEDPDTIRSIIDYRFRKLNNTDIKQSVIASIYNEGDLGLITATVLYEGEFAPYELIPEFITPGTLTLNDVEQISGVTKNSYEYSAEYLCTSKNGLYCRVYTIKIDFIKVSPAVAMIKSFTFPDYLNPGITKTSQAIIDESTKNIRAEIEYYGSEIPSELTPQFSATGPVYVSNIEQTSGFTEQDFKYALYYTVKSEEDSSVTKKYRVEILFKQDPASACELLTFGFLQNDNQTLTNDVEARITQRDLSVFALMPYGSGSKEGITLIPYFTAEGNVSVNGQSQISGVNAQDFSEEVIYTVTSKNGFYQKDYKVTLQESGDIIYVDINAVGRNNGTSWDDAFINLDLALNQAALMPAENAAEIWVTAPEDKTYVSTDAQGFKLYKEGSITILGGFDGTEKYASERQFDEKGNLLKRTKLEPRNSGYGLFHCNNLIKDYIYIEGIENKREIRFFFYTYDDGLGYVKSFEKSNITINDSEFNPGLYTPYASIASNGNTYYNTYNIKILNSEFSSLRASSLDSTFQIENCTVLTRYFDDIDLTCSNIIFNNNIISGGYANISLESTGELEFENNIASKPDDVIIKYTETYTGNITEIDEPVWNLKLKGKCDLILENMTFAYFHAGPGVIAEINNSKFIKAEIYNYKPVATFYIGSNADVTVNNSTFTNSNIEQYTSSSLTLNSCDVSIGGTRNIYSRGNLFINDGIYNLKGLDTNIMAAYGELVINGGTFNFEHEGKYTPCYLACNSTITKSNFNFIDNLSTNATTLAFQGDEYSSIIDNCNFIFLGSYGTAGVYSGQKDFTIKDSKIDIDELESDLYSGGINIEGEYSKILDSSIKINTDGVAFYNYDGILQIENSDIITTSKARGFVNYSTNTLNITDCTMNITSENEGIDNYGTLNITGGKLNIFSPLQGIYSASGSEFTIKNVNMVIESQSSGILSYHLGVIDGGTIKITLTGTGNETHYGIYSPKGFIKNANLTVVQKYVQDYFNASTLPEMMEIATTISTIEGNYYGIYADSIEGCTINKVMSLTAPAIYTNKIINTSITTSSKAFGASSFMFTNYIENCNINIEPQCPIGITKQSSASSFTIKGGTYTIKTYSNGDPGIMVLGVPITISDATFQNSISYNSCLYFSSNSVNIKNSIFIGCQNQAPKSIFAHRGGAVCINTHTAGASIVINKCTFKNNKILNESDEAYDISEGGGGLAVLMAANDVTLHVTNCTFDGNLNATPAIAADHFWASNNAINGVNYKNCNYSESGTTFTNPKSGQYGWLNK